MHIGEAVAATLEGVGQAGVVEAELMKNGRVQIVYVYRTRRVTIL